MPGALWARQRIKQRFLRHTYTRVARGQQAQPANGPAGQDQDAWGNPIALQDTDAGAPAAVPGVACLFVDKGQLVMSDEGPIQVDVPTLLVAFDDPLTIGDLVRNVSEPSTSEIYEREAVVDTMTQHTVAGPLLWKVFWLRHAEVD